MPDLPHLLREFSILAFPMLLAITFHELAHGYVADRLGDPTPRLAGRLTANPLVHLDPIGTLVFVITGMIGWAKPVPVNPAHFRNPRRDMLWVGLAGPVTNFGMAILMAGFFRLLSILPADSEFAARVLVPLLLITQAGVTLNLGLGLFNLIPIPPLDGSRVLAGVLPVSAARALYGLERYGFVILLVLVYSRGLDATIYPVLHAAARLLLGG